MFYKDYAMAYQFDKEEERLHFLNTTVDTKLSLKLNATL